VGAQVEGVDWGALLKAAPPPLYGLPTGTASAKCYGFADGIAGQKKEKDDLAHLPGIPAPRGYALRQRGA